jgi:membrane protein DedA with SNARE-associated domain
VAEAAEEPVRAAGVHRRRARLLVLAVPLVLVFATAALGNAVAPSLLPRHPLLLLALNATTRHLVLTSTTVAVVPWVVVGLLRRLLEDPFLYLMGRWYGDDAVAWVDRHLGGGRLLRLVQRRFATFGWPLVALFPGGAVCVLAGASGMGVVPFLALNVLGTLATLLLLRRFGEALADPVDAVVDFSGEHALVLTLATTALTVVWLARHRRRARSGDPSEG